MTSSITKSAVNAAPDQNDITHGKETTYQSNWIECTRRQDRLSLRLAGRWLLDKIAALDRDLLAFIKDTERLAPQSVDIRFDDELRLDTAGAWLLCRMERHFIDKGWQVTIVDSGSKHQSLIDEVRRATMLLPAEQDENRGVLRWIESLGKNVVDKGVNATQLLSFFGQTVLALVRSAVWPRRLRLTSLTHHLEQTCLHALPIVGLIAFLLGIVIAFQGADQLRRFGAELFTVDLVGVSILREIGILLTAIVVAGRSGSAFTAEIGAMAVNEEIDALRTLGLDPIEILVVPRMIALMIALPLLAFFADIMGLLGGGGIAWLALDITPAAFLAQLSEAIEPATFIVGMIKAPVFAFLIALVGCYRGLMVSGGADSVGQNTTRSVVTSIFLVIVFNALFSILFSYLGV